MNYAGLDATLILCCFFRSENPLTECEYTFFCDNRGITYVITASWAKLSLAHKCESKHTCTTFPALNTTQLQLTLFPLGNEWFCFLLQIVYPRCGDGCSGNFPGACCSLTGGAPTIDQYFGDCVFDSFCCWGNGDRKKTWSTENNKCMLC